MATRKYRVLDLFSGIAGFSLGFQRLEVDGYQPYEVVGYLEIDAKATGTLISALQSNGLSKEQAEQRVIQGDITQPQTKAALYRLCEQGSVDVILGGPPCQSFSTIGPRSGDKAKQERFKNDARDNLFTHYIEVVEYYKPHFFVFENVTGILSKRTPEGEKYIDIITSRFKDLGYTLEFPGMDQGYLVLNAADYGVPQKRNRVFIIGNRHGRLNPIPKPTHCPQHELKPGKAPWVTVRDAISDLPYVQPRITPTLPHKSRSRKVPEERLEQVRLMNVGRDPGQDERDYHWSQLKRHLSNSDQKRREYLEFVMPRNGSEAKLVGHIARSHQESDIAIFKGLDEGMSSKDLIDSADPRHQEILSLIKYKMDSFQDKYKKLAWDQPSGTVFAHLQKDGNRFIHPDSSQGRTLTVREAARLQSFPDDYPIEATGNLRFKYIGNAVPPMVGRAIAKALYDILQNL